MSPLAMFLYSKDAPRGRKTGASRKAPFEKISTSSIREVGGPMLSLVIESLTPMA